MMGYIYLTYCKLHRITLTYFFTDSEIEKCQARFSSENLILLTGICKEKACLVENNKALRCRNTARSSKRMIFTKYSH